MLADIRQARKIGFDVVYDEDECEISEIADTLHSLLDAMEDFPEDFFRKGGLRHVRITKRMTSIDGNFTAGGFGGGDTMTLPVGSGFSRGLLAHEMYHIFDGRSCDDSAWGRLNHRDFIYRQQRAEMNFNFTEKEQKRYLKKLANSPKKAASNRVERALGKKVVKQIAKNDDDPEIQAGFVSRYAQTNQREDRADTFATMYCEQEAFLPRAENNSVLGKKMKFIQEETKNWLGDRYWKQVAEYGTDPDVYVLSSPMTTSNDYQRVTIPRTFFSDDILVRYGDLKGKIRPGKPVERIMKRLRGDVERALSAPDSKSLTERKREAIKIAQCVKDYKTTLVERAAELKDRGDTRGVEKAVRLLIDTWPSKKEHWLKMFGMDVGSP